MDLRTIILLVAWTIAIAASEVILGDDDRSRLFRLLNMSDPSEPLRSDDGVEETDVEGV